MTVASFGGLVFCIRPHELALRKPGYPPIETMKAKFQRKAIDVSV